ncbi:MAG: MSCRAMM family adhesin SdrC, partial [Desulfovibrionaceae bacterium]|nr:MSCRAMM family adhesin SdrC [Desulfovibrionaceae bacterium]
MPTPAKTAGPEAASGASSGTNKNAAALRAVVDADLADDTLIVRLEAEDAGLLPYFVPALGGATLRTEIRAHAPLLPPAPEGPLEVRLRGAFAVRAAGQTAFGKMSALGLDLRWDGRRRKLPELAVSMPEEQPQLTLRGGGGLDPLLGPGAALTAGVRDLRTLSVLLGLSQQEPAGTATVRLELGHGRILRDWWRDSLWDSGADSSRTAASAARQDSRNAARVASYDGSHDNSSDGSADSTIDHRRDALRDGSRDDSRAVRADRKRDNIVHSFPDSVIRSSQSSSDDGLDDEAHDNRGNSGTHHKGRASHDSSSDVARYAAADGFPKASSKEARDGS